MPCWLLRFSVIQTLGLITQSLKINYCLFNDMHGQNINLPVCVSVCKCVRHTFCQLAYTGQTPQRIFTTASLKYADLRKDVPFGGLDDE